jgi:hypothetical protein
MIAAPLYKLTAFVLGTAMLASPALAGNQTRFGEC